MSPGILCLTSQNLPWLWLNDCSIVFLKFAIDHGKAGLCFQFYWTINGPLTRYIKLRVANAPRIPGTFSPSLQVSDLDMHHGTCVTHVPSCMPESLTSGFIWSLRRGKGSWHCRCMRNPQFHVSGKSSCQLPGTLWPQNCTRSLVLSVKSSSSFRWTHIPTYRKSDEKVNFTIRDIFERDIVLKSVSVILENDQLIGAHCFSVRRIEIW